MQKCKTANILSTLKACLVVSLFPLVVCAADGERKPAFTNQLGWTWHVRPSSAFSIPGSSASRGVAIHLDELKNEELLLSLGHGDRIAADVVQFRPVAFGASGERFEFNSAEGSGDEGITLRAFTLDLKKHGRDSIKFIGIEKLTKSAFQDVVAPAAFQRLRSANVNALPFPRVGEPYEFELVAIDGTKVRSKELRGKVVLLDFWAKWCAPCMAKMPKLKTVYRDLHGRGLEIIGLNHDYSASAAKQVIKEQELPWANVHAPEDRDQRQLWMTATGTEFLPRLLLIDREGILRGQATIGDLEAEIERLVNK